MSARIVGMNGELDEPENEGNPLEGLTVPGQSQDPEPQAQNVEDFPEDLPEKFRGKSPRELLEIAMNQDSVIGRQGLELGELRNQVGTLRGTVDQALALRDPGHAANLPATEEEELTDRDFALDPVDATRRMIQKETRDLSVTQAELNAQARALQFERMHPTADADLRDEKFAEFVKASPTRTRLAQQAFSDMSNPDFDAADQLWDLYEEYKSFRPTEADLQDSASNDDADVSQAQSAQPPKEVPAMVTGNSGGSANQTSKTGGDVYSQAALNDLQARDPDLYFSERVQGPLRKAYAEGRVVQDV